VPGAAGVGKRRDASLAENEIPIGVEWTCAGVEVLGDPKLPPASYRNMAADGFEASMRRKIVRSSPPDPT